MDEEGIPSRHRWLRCFNPSKATNQILYRNIDGLLFGCSFLLGFFHYRILEKNSVEQSSRWACEIKVHPGKTLPARVQQCWAKHARLVWCIRCTNDFFARKLREFTPDNPMTYRIFADSRWDSILGVVKAYKLYNVTFTVTIKKVDQAFPHCQTMEEGQKQPEWINREDQKSKQQSHRCYRVSHENTFLIK